MRRQKLFQDRWDAGRQLAERLSSYREQSPVVLGLPRGGVPVAYEVARALEAPLDVCVVRKLGAPSQPELAIGAVAEDGALHLDRDRIERLGVPDAVVASLIDAKRAEVAERVARFRHGAPALDVRGKTVVVVDDGVATGSTARAALQTLRARGAQRVVLAVPVGAVRALADLASAADDVVCLHAKEVFVAVGVWYQDFSATSDGDVVALLDHARLSQALREPSLRDSARVRTLAPRDVSIPIERSELEGILTIPAEPRGLVIFAHGSGSSRRSPRNQHVAEVLEMDGLATLRFDLLTAEEERLDARTAELRFDIDLLASRLVRVTDWAHADARTSALDIGYFGASTGAAAGLVAASRRPQLVHAVVSRGGRPDLAGGSLADVAAPTLLVVGGDDMAVVELNREALDLLACEKRLEVIPGATHLFEESGALDEVARLAAGWLRDHLGRARVLESIA